MSLDAIGIVVSDLNRARDFYAHLGLNLPEDDDHAEVELAGGLRLMFDKEEIVKSFDPEWSRGTGSPSHSLAFSFETPGEVDAKYEELLAAGGQGHREPWDAFWGMRYAQLRDPDGNGIDLYAQLPESGD